MNEKAERELLKIQDRVERMRCSNGTIEEIQKLLSTAMQIAERMDFVGNENLCLKHLTKTEKDDLEPLLNAINKPRKRIELFENLKREFLIDLSHECIGRERVHRSLNL